MRICICAECSGGGVKMGRVVVFLVAVFASLTLASCQLELPCYLPLRRIPSLSRFFKHCKIEIECVYNEWTHVKPVHDALPVAVPFEACKSELALLGERWQVAVTKNSECEDRREESYMCMSTCSYEDWTDVSPYVHATAVRVPVYQCKSGRALPGERRQLARGYECRENHCEECRDKIEERYICEPTITERLIVLLELGRTGQNHQEDRQDFPENIMDYLYYKSRSQMQRPLTGNNLLTPFDKFCGPTQICWKHQQDKRPLVFPEEMDGEPQIEFIRSTTTEPEPLTVDPIPFDLFRFGELYRRQNNVECHPDSARYVLFLLDTSDSISREDFSKITSSLSSLAHYFCRRIKIAAVTFSNEQFVEFCFDCFGNDCSGRDNARDAMADVKYRGGSSKSTGEAVQCACDTVLTPDCGFPKLPITEGATSLDVVYVTDGKSDRRTDICKEVQCLYDLEELGVELNVFAFGIGSYNADNLKCITRDKSVNYINNKIFEFDNAYQLQEAVNAINDIFDKSILGRIKYFYDESGSGTGSESGMGSGMESGSGLYLGSGMESGSELYLGSGMELGSGVYYLDDVVTSDCFAIGASDEVRYDDCS